jgi:hypothetical protein
MKNSSFILFVFGAMFYWWQIHSDQHGLPHVGNKLGSWLTTEHQIKSAPEFINLSSHEVQAIQLQLNVYWP